MFCPRMVKTRVYCDFIIDSVFVDAVLKHIPGEDQHGLIFLPVSALQICSVPIGEYVVVETNSGRIVRKAWKSHDRAVLTAAVCEQG